VQGEYFIDGDPGAGNGTPLAGVAGDDHNGEWTLSQGELSALSDGVHFVGVRFQDDAGTWGLTTYQAFVTPVTHGDSIAEMEWTLYQNNVALQSGTWSDATGPVVEMVHRLVEPTAVENVPVILRVTPIGATGIAGMPSDLAMDYTSFRQDFLNEHFTVAEQGQELVSGETADPDGDGMNNRFERAFGLDPRVAEPGARGQVFQMKEGGVLEFGTPRGASISEVDGFVELGDLRFQLMVSDDLSAWDPAVLGTDFTLPLRDNTPTVNSEKHRVPILREGSASRFFQLLLKK